MRPHAGARSLSLRRLRPWPWHLVRTRAIALALVASALGVTSCRRPPSPAPEAALAVAELGDAVSALGQQTADLQAQVDSLRRVVARQDTLLRQIARLAGLSVPP